MAKKHLEEMVDITKKIGYNDVKFGQKTKKELEEEKMQKERED